MRELGFDLPSTGVDAEERIERDPHERRIMTVPASMDGIGKRNEVAELIDRVVAKDRFDPIEAEMPGARC